MIIVKLQGGLGNQMFQYALAKHLAIKHQTDVVCDLVFLNHRIPGTNYVFREYDLDIFSRVNEDTTTLSKAPKILRNPVFIFYTLINKMLCALKYKQCIHESGQYEFDDRVLQAPDGVRLSGYWQNEKYFTDIANTIREDFSSFRYPLSERAKNLKRELEQTNAVCVNFRRTDYVTNSETKEFHGDVGDEFYKKATELIADRVSNPHLYVFSDDIAWCKENFKTTLPVTFVGHSYAGEKFSEYLQLMIACKHFVIPNSTFAWWAAWLSDDNGKIVVAPKKWVASDTVDADDMVPRNWIQI